MGMQSGLWCPREIRIWALVNKDGPAVASTLGPCWLWTGYRDRNGYGRLGGQWAHRVVYKLAGGDIPEGLELDHLCRNRPCVNPGHLEVVTPYENWWRGESASAKAARATHCKNGHPWDEINTYLRKPRNKTATPTRMCRVCRRERMGRYNREKASA